jgi:hypothetical protein
VVPRIVPVQRNASQVRGSILQPIPKSSHAAMRVLCKGLEDDFYKTSMGFSFLALTMHLSFGEY